jgi:hypothetical protein
MGTSTVSGPFRSQNGFQELVDGVWTPVGGGGGGASLPVIMAIPENGSDNVVYLTEPTTVGQVYSFEGSLPVASPNGAIAIRLPIDGGLQTFYGTLPVYNSYGYPSPLYNVYFYGTGSPDMQIYLPATSPELRTFSIQIVYIGIDLYGYKRYAVSGQVMVYSAP